MSETEKYILVGAALFNWSETQRMMEIADELSLRGYRIVFIGSGKYDALLEGKKYIRELIPYDSEWYTQERIGKMLAMDQYGNRYASEEEIGRIVEAEVQVLKKYRPAVILTGYRMSLTVSAKICRIPIVWTLSAVLSRAYLKKLLEDSRAQYKNRALPYQTIRSLYENKIACEKLLGESKTSGTWNAYLVKNGREPFSCDRDIYTGDLNLMSDAAELFPTLKEGDGYRFIGPIFNSQHISVPDVIAEALGEPGKKKVLISIGSAGKKELLKKILHAVAEEDCLFFVSVIGVLTQEEIEEYPSNFYFCEKFPLIEVAGQCDAAVIQGGQGTLYAMIAAQCPFVALPAFFEQRQNVENLLAHYSCGEMLLPFQLSETEICTALRTVLASVQIRDGIRETAAQIGRYLKNPRLSAVVAADHIERMLRERKGGELPV